MSSAKHNYIFVNIFMVVRESFYSHFCYKMPGTKKAFHEQHNIMSSTSCQGGGEGLHSYSKKSGRSLLSRHGGGEGQPSYSTKKAVVCVFLTSGYDWVTVSA